MDTKRRKPKAQRAASVEGSVPGNDCYLCQVYPLYDDSGYPVVQARICESLVLGREADLGNRLRIFDYAVSREHCRLETTSDGLILEDLGSTNGTFVNRTRVRRTRLQPQDVVRVGDALFVVTDDVPASDPPAGHEEVVAASPPMVQLVERLNVIAASDRRVMVLGPTGTGKGVVVELLHRMSGRTGPLVTVNCASLQEALLETTLFGNVAGAFTGARPSRGLVARAHRGTLFLDELGELPEHLQAKLLRFVETGEVLPVGETRPTRFDVRLATATHRGQQTLRPDLLARLEDEVLMLPPLAHRREEIVALLCLELRRQGFSPGKTLTADTVEGALVNPWPRNTRQLIKQTRRALAGLNPGDLLPLGALEEVIGEATPRVEPVQSVAGSTPPSPAAIKQLLRATRGNVAEAARRLSCHRRQLYRWMARYGIER